MLLPSRLESRDVGRIIQELQPLAFSFVVLGFFFFRLVGRLFFLLCLIIRLTVCLTQASLELDTLDLRRAAFQQSDWKVQGTGLTSAKERSPSSSSSSSEGEATGRLGNEGVMLDGFEDLTVAEKAGRSEEGGKMRSDPSLRVNTRTPTSLSSYSNLATRDLM